MSQNQGCCDCNDYSLQTANMGIANITNGNTALTGASAAPVFTASSSFSGSIIKSIRIKATMPVTTGMLRLFVGNTAASLISLYKEIPVPVTPTLDATPTPFPLMPTFEMMLQGGLKLLSGYKLYATTQNSQSFNIITEGLDWKYPTTLNAGCNYKQDTAVTGLGTVSAGVTSLTPSGGSVTTIFTAPASVNGAFIKTVTIKALQSTSVNGAVRLFISSDGTNFLLFQEIIVPQTDQSGFDSSWKAVVELNMNINTGYALGATTQLSQSFAITVEATTWTYPIS